mgnify:CR=1 FL=1
MNKFEEEIWKRYGSFELSHDKNKLIVDNIQKFISDVAIEFGDFCRKLPKDNKEILRETPNCTIQDLFKIFINEYYGL